MMKVNPSFEYQLYNEDWRSSVRVERNGKGLTRIIETVGGVDSKPVETPLILTDEQREQLPQIIASLTIGPAETIKRSASMRAEFVSEGKGAAWTEPELTAGAPAELRGWIESVGHPVYRAAEVALRRAEALEDKSQYDLAARAYKQAVARLASWWMPKGLRNDTNIPYQIARQAEEDRRFGEASAGYLKVLKIRMEVYRQKYRM